MKIMASNAAAQIVSHFILLLQPIVITLSTY
jgi:hypothetical protein